MEETIRILLIEDADTDATLIDRVLQQAGVPHETRRVQTREALLHALEAFSPDVVLSDFTLPTFDGLAALGLVHERYPDTPFIFVSGTIGEEAAIQSLTQGASDYIVKGNLKRLVPAIRRALREAAEQAARRQADEALREAEQRYESLVELSPDAIYVVTDGVIAFVNDAAVKLYGARGPEQLIGRRNIDFVHEESLGEVTVRMRRLLEVDERQLLIEQRHVRLDGSSVYVEIASAPYSFRGRRSALVVARDVTSRKIAQARTAMEHAVTRLLANSGNPSMVIARILHAIGETIGWVCGACWLRETYTDTLTCIDAWGVQRIEIEEFMQFYARKGHAPSPGGLLRRVLTAGEPRWIADITTESELGRTPMLSKAGVRSVFAFPIVAGTGTLGVMEFFGEDQLEPDLALVSLAHALGHQIGQYWQRKQAEEVAGLRLLAVESSVNAIIITDCTRADHPIEYVNPAFTRITGYSVGEVLGRNCRFLQGRDTDQPALDKIRLGIKEATGVTVTLRNYRKDRTLFWNELQIAPVRDRSDNVVRFIGVMNDITERKSYELELEYQANHDGLTGLANRNLFTDRLQQAIASAKRQGAMVAIAFIDLDNFKFINDSFGHGVGDQLLRNVAERLAASVRETDTVARQGGDEFAVLLADLEERSLVTQLVERMVEMVSRVIRIDGQEIYLNCSVGVSLFPADAQDGDEALRNADIAMYRAKELGRNNVQFYTPEMNARSMERLTLEAGLRRALERGEFVLRYQPQVDLYTGRIVGAEALIRWEHPERGTVPPFQFIPLAEDTGLILPIGQWVLGTATRFNRSLQQAGLPPVVVSVNVSARQFWRPGLVAYVEQVLKESGLEPNQLELELTESMVALRAEVAETTLKALKDLGVKLAIDDFGTGYSSLSQLKRFPVDSLKIDQSFVRGITTDRDDAMIAKSIIALATSLELTVIAEGVESYPQLAFLREHGCSLAQGYYLGRPMGGDDFRRLLETGGVLNIEQPSIDLPEPE